MAGVLTILNRLRNTVHGQAIEATPLHSGQVHDAPVILPARDERQILACMGNAGGQAAWGTHVPAERSALTPASSWSNFPCSAQAAEHGHHRGARSTCPWPEAITGLQARLVQQAEPAERQLAAGVLARCPTGQPP
jgi:hypothetical protein